MTNDQRDETLSRYSPLILITSPDLLLFIIINTEEEEIFHLVDTFCPI